MNFREAWTAGASMLTEGAVVERLRRESGLALDPHLVHAGLVYSEAGRTALRGIYAEYAGIARKHGLALLQGTPTWRANRERLAKAGLSGRDVNGDCARFVRALREEGRGRSGREGEAPVFIGGLMGCKGDAYRPEEGLTAAEAEDFHAFQVEALAAAGVDFLWAVTLPALPEAQGMARALAKAAAARGIPYVVSFVLNRAGRLLDGTALEEAMVWIDDGVEPRPLWYMANCCHPTFLRAGLEAMARRVPAMLGRFAGLQANASSRSAEELDGLEHVDAGDPEEFGAMMAGLRRDFCLRVLGGCCGTDGRHLRAVAGRLASGDEG